MSALKEWWDTDGGRMRAVAAKNKRITKEETQRMLKVVRSCSTAGEVAKALGISRPTLSMRLRRTEDAELHRLALQKGIVKER